MKETRSTIKALMSTLCLFLTLGILTVNFQNCSGLSSADYGSDSDTVSQGTSGLISVDDDYDDDEVGVEAEGLTAVFSSGDSYVGQTLVSSGSFLDTLIGILGYENYSSGGKAIAMAVNGLGYAAFTETTNAEAERMAIETCNLLSGKSCALLVLGDLFVVNSSAAFTSLEYRLDGFTGLTFSRGDIPMSSTRVRNSAVVSNFINAPGHRALALSPTGGAYSVFTTTYSVSIAEAKRMAVQQCELEASIVPCIIYAVDDEVVFNAEAWIKTNSINFTNNNVAAVTPPASRNNALSLIKEMLADVGQEKYAIYITPSGYGYFGRDETDVDVARAEALSDCESGVHSSRCIPYASSTGVNLSSADLYAKDTYPGLFCKTVRYNCSAHLKAGCASGAQYWVQDPSTLEAELTVCGS